MLVAYRGGPLVGVRMRSWKQCPAVSTQRDATSAPLHALSYAVPSSAGTPVKSNRAANGYAAAGAGTVLAADRDGAAGPVLAGSVGAAGVAGAEGPRAASRTSTVTAAPPAVPTAAIASTAAPATAVAPLRPCPRIRRSSCRS